MQFIEVHTTEAIAAEVELMRNSPEMLWWLYLINGDIVMRENLDEILRTEAYNRLTNRMFIVPL